MPCPSCADTDHPFCDARSVGVQVCGSFRLHAYCLFGVGIPIDSYCLFDMDNSATYIWGMAASFIAPSYCGMYTYNVGYIPYQYIFKICG
jgi:hypothetical protein